MVANCLGGWENFTCSTGHIGALCEACDIYGKYTNGVSYTNSGNFVCGSCSDISSYNAIIILGITMVTLIFVTFSVKSNIRMLECFILSSFMRTMGLT